MPVTSFEIRKREPFEGGQSFGATGAYERIEGVLHYAVDPNNESNAGIIDIKLAERGADGLVHFEGDVTLLQPADVSKANGRLLADVVNRGGPTFMRYNLAVGDPLHREVIPAGDGFLFERGWTIACIGWQWDVDRSNGRLGLTAPQALGADGKPIAGSVIVTYQGNEPADHFLLSDRGHQPYPAADVNELDARLFVRDDPLGTRQAVAREKWQFARVENGTKTPDSTHVSMDEPFEMGRWYEAIYTTNICPVVGTGLLAFRDATSFLRYSDADDNPAKGRITHAFGMGISQSGRFLREFLSAGANLDEAGRKTYDGLHTHIAGGRRGEFNHRYAQPSVIEPFGLGHRPPFAYEDTTNPFDKAAIPGLLTRLRARNGVPQIIATNSGTEYWRGDASMMHIDPNGAVDAPETPEARAYYFAGTQHGSGTLPFRHGNVGTRTSTANALNIINYMPLLRAALTNLDQWVTAGVEPPASAIPKLSDGSAVTRDRAAYDYMSLPLNMLLVRRLWALPELNFGEQVDQGIGSYPPVMSLTKVFPSFVSAVDKDGNDKAGIRLPDIQVPLATHTGWNPRHPDVAGLDQTQGLSGSTIPFAKATADRDPEVDPRPAIEERYAGREDYEARVRSAAEELAAQRYLLPSDVEVVTKNAMDRWDALTA